ncbi:MAG: regulatory protein RecX [Lachnospiraceae bacterium]|nr:regulatory protein RecX [Lachnospiraceae bacterium]
MYIFRLEPYKKTKVKVYFDEGDPAFVLYKKEIEKYDIREGQELSEETYDEILNEILIKRAVSRTLYLLDASAKTESQIRRKLKEGFYPQEAIDAAVRYAGSKHYIDDEYYASAFAQQKLASKSKQMVRKELLQRGIDPDTVGKALEDAGTDDKETIRKLIIKKYPPGTELDAKEAAKLMRSLSSKGFYYEDIRAEMEDLHIDITYNSD